MITFRLMEVYCFGGSNYLPKLPTAKLRVHAKEGPIGIQGFEFGGEGTREEVYAIYDYPQV